MAQMMNEVAIKVKSQELEIPYGNLLCACLLEDALLQIAQSSYAQKLWIGNAASLGLEQYKRKRADRLEYYYPKSDQNLDIDAMLQEIFTEKTDHGICWSWRIAGQQNRLEDEVLVNMRARLGAMEVPISLIFISSERERLTPIEHEFRLCMQNNDRVNCLLYPWEHIVAESLAQIIEKLELLNDLGCYQEVHGIIHREALDARIVQEQLGRLCRERHILPEEKRMTMLLEYRSYSYMRKRWNRYLKTEKMTSPAWDEVMSDMEQFLKPIWEMILEDTIFIADWMPELQRFLD